MKDLRILNGPNLNLLGTREESLYGAKPMDGIVKELEALSTKAKLAMDYIQSNHEGTLVDTIQQKGAGFLIINLGAFTHTSIALRDALLAVKTSFIEVHVSNVYQREPFRHTSLISDLPSCKGVIVGFGPLGYRLAFEAFTLTMADAS